MSPLEKVELRLELIEGPKHCKKEEKEETIIVYKILLSFKIKWCFAIYRRRMLPGT